MDLTYSLLTILSTTIVLVMWGADIADQRFGPIGWTGKN